MPTIRFATIAFASILLGSATTQLTADQYTIPARHNVVRTDTPPIIDGIVDGDEWGSDVDCSPSTPESKCNTADGWVNLRADTADAHNLRFRMLWDDDNLYILGRSDYHPNDFADGFVPAFETSDVRFAPDNPDWNGTGYAGTFAFDPNTDGERTWTPNEPVLASEVDGYQISWDIHEGFAARGPTADAPDQSLRDPLNSDGQSINDYFGGMRLEAHVNSPFGNQGEWELDSTGPNGNYRDDAFPGLTFAQYAYNEDDSDTEEIEQPGAVWEWAIPWQIFNATDPNRLVTEEEAAARPENVVDTRETIVIPDPEAPGLLLQIENPDFDQLVPNVGQVPGIERFIGDAGDPDLRFSDPDSDAFLDNGLYAPDGPDAGDVWAFEAGVFTNDFMNSLPSWSEPLGGDPARGGSFSLWGAAGHGQITFLASGETGFEPGTEITCVVPFGVLGGDLDRSNDVGFADFLVLSANFGQEDVGYEGGDIDCDGFVGFADFLVLSSNFGRTVEAAASVPEPHSHWMVLTAFAAGLYSLRRKRS